MGETFGQRVYQARLALQAALGREVTQAEVGKAVGVTGQAVGLWETGKSEPKLDVIIRLAKKLQSEPAWLAFGIITIKGTPVEVPPGTPNSVPIVGEVGGGEKPSIPPAKPGRGRRRAVQEREEPAPRAKKRGRGRRAS